MLMMDDATKALRVLRGADNGLQGLDAIAWIVGLSHSTPTVLSVLRCLHEHITPTDLVAEAGETHNFWSTDNFRVRIVVREFVIERSVDCSVPLVVMVFLVVL
jgi:hypothetical protein